MLLCFRRLQCKLADAPNKQGPRISTAFQHVENPVGRSASTLCAVASRRSGIARSKAIFGSVQRVANIIASGARR